MKRISLILVLQFLSSTLLFSQDETTEKSKSENQEYKTLFKKDGKTKVSGFGGITMEFSGVNKNFAYSMGGVGAVLINQSFFIGAYGQGLANSINYTNPTPYFRFDEPRIVFGHGGFYVGYVFQANKPFHFGVSSKFGWGAITMYDYYSSTYPNYENDNVFVITPQVEAEINFAKWFKINMGLGYRITTGVDATYQGFYDPDPIPYFDSDAFNCMTFQLGFYFGWFK